MFEEFNKNLFLWKCEVTTIKKGKIFNVSHAMVHLSKKISYRSSYLLVQYAGFLYLILNLDTLTHFSNVTSVKNSFRHSFLKKIAKWLSIVRTPWFEWEDIDFSLYRENTEAFTLYLINKCLKQKWANASPISVVKDERKREIPTADV